MKQKNYKMALIAVLLALGSAACKKSFLETNPKGSLIAKTSSDYNLMLNNLNLISIPGTNAQVTMGDEIAAVDPYFSASVLKTQRTFLYKPVIYEPNEDAGETLIPLQNVYLFNKIINEVPNATDGTPQLRLSIAAEARACRAWTYFLLINYYGKPYRATSASADPGFPIIEAADVTATKFERASVQAVYDFIIKDLTTAIPNLPTQITTRIRMSKPAAEAILGKVYLFMGRFSDALPMLNAAMTDMADQPTPVRLYDYNNEFKTNGVFLPVNTINGPAWPFIVNNVEVMYAKQFADNWTVSNDEIVTTPQTAALFGPTDLRLKFYSNSTYSAQQPYPVPGMLRHNSMVYAPFGVQVNELYLLRAEAKCRISDLLGAKADVEALRVKRMPAADASVPAATAASQILLLKFILDERIREFAVQGYRWFDMRRLSVDPLFQGTAYTHTEYSTTGAPTLYTLTPDRLTLQIPPKLMNQNPDLVNNP